ncbi:hypothetical protein [Nocardioides sp. InS609-2]|uniref:hypothetical protein n=1 Tax=Nocardioides sp. InS609-2 TaxID=2760705 RepID=UPI0020BEDF24|nr:hypothetical protein [Nocardioides sp. InS609-2]
MSLMVGVLGVAGSAGWFAGRSGRRLRHLKAHAELLPLLPDGDAKKRFIRHLEIQLLVHMHREETPEVRRALDRASIAIAVGLCLAVAVLGMSAWSLLADDPSEGVLIVQLLVFAAMLGSLFIARRATRQAGIELAKVKTRLEAEVQPPAGEQAET